MANSDNTGQGLSQKTLQSKEIEEELIEKAATMNFDNYEFGDVIEITSEQFRQVCFLKDWLIVLD